MRVFFVSVCLWGMTCRMGGCEAAAIEAKPAAAAAAVEETRKQDNLWTMDDISELAKSQDFSSFGGVLTAALVGVTVGLFVDPARRKDIFAAVGDRRDDGYEPNYAERISAFQRNIGRNLGASARSATSWARSGVTGGFRRIGAAGKYGAHVAQKSVHNVANAIRRASTGAKNLGSLAATGVKRIGTGIARAGHASSRGLARVGSGYVNNLLKVRDTAKSSLSRIGSTYSRGLSRVGQVYQRGLSRMGYAAEKIGSVAGGGVSRIGEMASDGVEQLETLGGMATELAGEAAAVVPKGVAALAEAAAVVPKGVAALAESVPKGMAAVANEKKVQDCLMQTLCYASSPFIGSNEVARKKRSLIRSLTRHLRSADDDGDRLNDAASSSENEERLLEGDDGAFRMDDCDVFNCEVAQMGRRAYGFVRNMGDEQKIE